MQCLCGLRKSTGGGDGGGEGTKRRRRGGGGAGSGGGDHDGVTSKRTEGVVPWLWQCLGLCARLKCRCGVIMA